MTQDEVTRGNLVISQNGNKLVYNVDVPSEDISVDKIGESNKAFSQIFVLSLDWNKVEQNSNYIE